MSDKEAVIRLPLAKFVALIDTQNASRKAEKSGATVDAALLALNSVIDDFISNTASAVMFGIIDLDAVREEGVDAGIQKAIHRLEKIGCPGCVEHVKDFQRAKAMP